VDAGAVQLELVLTGYKEVERNLEQLRNVGGFLPKNPFKEWDTEVSKAAIEANKLKRQLARGDNKSVINVGPLKVTQRQLKLLRVEAWKTSRSFKRAFADMNKAVKGFSLGLGNLGQFVGGISLTAFVANIIRVGTASNQARRQITFLAEGYKELEEAQATVARVAAVTNQSQLAVEKSFGRVYSVLRPIGLELKQIEVIYVGFNNAARLAGASQQEATGALLQFKQALSVGYAAGNDLNTILTQMSPLAEQIAKSYDKLNGTVGTTVGDLKKLGSQGKLTNDVLFEAAKTLAALDVPAPTTLQDISGAFENLSQNIAAAIGPAIIDAMTTFASILTVIAEEIDKNKEAITGFVDGVISFIRNVGPFVGGIYVAIKAWTLYRKGVLLAAKAQAFLLALSGIGIKPLLAGLAIGTAAGFAIDKAFKGVGDTMDDLGKKMKNLKKEFKDGLAGVDGPGAELSGPKQALEQLKEQNNELKRSEKLALEQSKSLYGPKTQAVIAARIKAAQAERLAAIEQGKADLKKGKDLGLNEAAKDAANASLVAAEEAARVIKEAYKDARDAARDAADSLGEARSKRSQQLFNKDEGINQFLSGEGLWKRQKEGIRLQKAETKRLYTELKKVFTQQGNFAGARQLANLRFTGSASEQFAQRQKFIDAAREELYGQKALITANEKLTKALGDLQTVIVRGFDGGTSAQREDFNALKQSIDNLTQKDWTVGVDARLEADGSITVQNALS